MSEPTATDRFSLLLYKGTGGDTVPVSDYLAEVRNSEPDWKPYLGMIAVDLTVAGTPLWPARVGMGDLARWTFQMEAASGALRRGERAIIRIPVDDAPVGGFFLMEPDADTVRISVVDVADPDTGYRYPVDREGRPVPEVYESVQAAFATSMGDGQTEGGLPGIHGVAFPRERLIDDLTREAKQGRELYDELGVPYYLELY